MEQPPSEVNSNKQKLSFITTFIGSGFFSGYAPFITGTVGSAVALLFFLIPSFHDPFTIIPATVILFFTGGLAAEEMEKVYGQDPAVVTIDEVVGMLVSLWFIPPTVLNIIVAFLIFRILDILKPYPAQLFDRKSGGWNIMLDDVVAGVYTNIILQIALHWF
jgi:phosphatidylglycerophosphatase A